jgi:hypothetical protein
MVDSSQSRNVVLKVAVNTPFSRGQVNLHNVATVSRRAVESE